MLAESWVQRHCHLHLESGCGHNLCVFVKKIILHYKKNKTNQKQNRQNPPETNQKNPQQNNHFLLSVKSNHDLSYLTNLSGGKD